MARERWFCGSAATMPWHDRAIGFHKDAETTMTPWIVVLRTTWQSATVLVPRCARCHGGHRIEQALMALAIAAVIVYAASGQLDVLFGILSGTPEGGVLAVVWAVVVLVPAVAWIAVRQAWLPWKRLAPRRLRHARGHPDVLGMRDDGSRFRPGPFPEWRQSPDSYPHPPPTRFRRVVAVTLGLLGFCGIVATVVLYLWVDEELAGGVMLVGVALGFLSTRIDPDVWEV